MEDEKPKWEYRMTLSGFERLWGSTITAITHHRRQVGCDESENWIEFHDGRQSFRAPQHWEEFFKFAPTFNSLIQPTYAGMSAAKQLDAIRRWEKKHARDIAEYNRLKAKFG